MIAMVTRDREDYIMLAIENRSAEMSSVGTAPIPEAKKAKRNSHSSAEVCAVLVKQTKPCWFSMSGLCGLQSVPCGSENRVLLSSMCVHTHIH